MRQEFLAASVAALVLGSVLRVAERRLRVYARALGHDVNKSHSYDTSHLEVTNLSPGQGGRHDAVDLLEVEFRSTPLGRFVDPRLVVQADGESHEFWLERGGRGRRYLALPAASSIRVETRHVRLLAPVRHLDAGSGGVPGGPLLIVAPHPDDAEIAAYGLYRERAADAHIVVVTAGDRGRQYAPGADRPGGWTSWLRRFDGLTVPLLAGVAADRIESLDLPEDALREGVASASLPELESRLADVVERVRPSAVVVPHPVLETHPAHLACTLATLRALRRTGARAEALFCLIHVPKAGHYPLGPRHAAVPLPPWHGGGVQFERLAIQRLSPVAQAEKLFALDAHHDLRPPPAPLSRPESVIRLLRRRWRAWTTGVEAVASRDYLRRAPRPYELFLAVSPEGLPAYLESLERRRTGSA